MLPTLNHAKHLTQVLVVTLIFAGCMPYRWPRPDEPHAVVKLRRVLHRSPGDERLITAYIGINERSLWRTGERSDEPRRATDSARIYPGPNRIRLSATFTHEESEWVEEVYQVPRVETRYETVEEHYPTVCGARDIPPCTRTVQKSRQVRREYTEERTRTVQRTKTVTDDICSATAEAVFEAGGVYLLQYTYAGYDSCSLICLQHQPASGETEARYTPCRRAALPSPVAAAEKANVSPPLP